jgi:hypothetical protein
MDGAQDCLASGTLPIALQQFIFCAAPQITDLQRVRCRRFFNRLMKAMA